MPGQLRYFVCLPVARSSLFFLLRNSTVRKANVRPNFTVSASISSVSPFFAALRKLNDDEDECTSTRWSLEALRDTQFNGSRFCRFLLVSFQSQRRHAVRQSSDHASMQCILTNDKFDCSSGWSGWIVLPFRFKCGSSRSNSHWMWPGFRDATTRICASEEEEKDKNNANFRFNVYLFGRSVTDLLPERFDWISRFSLLAWSNLAKLSVPFDWHSLI